MSEGDSVEHGADGWEAPEGFNFTRDVVERFAVDAGRPALTFVDAEGIVERQSFAQVAADAARWAHLLRGSGYEPGDRVVVALGSAPESIGALLGAIKGGLVAVPCPGRIAAQELAFRTGRSGARLLLADRTAESEIAAARELLDDEPDVLFLDEAHALLNRCRPIAPTEPTAAGYHAFVLFTAGVTGTPKAVAHTHAATFAAGPQAGYWLGLKPGDVVWSTAANWWGESVWNLLGCWAHGAEVVVHAGAFDPLERLELLEYLGVSVLGQTPREYAVLAGVDRLGAARPSRLRHAFTAGEPVSPDVIARFGEALSVTVCEGYGQTDDALLLASTAAHPAPIGALGHPVPGHHVAVIDEDGEEMPLGEEGEIALQGRPASLFDRYWGDPAATSAVFRGAWYLTGDRATRDEDGSFWLTGRSDDVIVTDGLRVGAFEVERALLEHGAVAESAAVGKSDPDRGELVKAFVVLRPDQDPSRTLAQELVEHARRYTESNAFPREVEFVTELPRTAGGKVRRIELRSLERERAGVAEPTPDEVTPPRDEERRAAFGHTRRAEAARRRTAERERRAAASEARRAEERRHDAEGRRQAKEDRRREADEARLAEQEAKRAEEARLAAEAEEQRNRAAAEREAEKLAELARRQAAKDAKQAARDAKRAAKEAELAEARRARAEATERARREEQERRASEEAMRAEESRRRAEEKEAARLAEAQRREEEEERKREAERLRAEDDERRRAAKAEREAELDRQRAEHERLRAEVEAVRRAEAEERLQAESERKRSLSAERQRREEKQRADAEAAKSAAEEQARQRQVEATRRELEQAERRRRRSRGREPEPLPTTPGPEDDPELGSIILERLQAYGRGDGSDADG
jgi:acyl-coenzyme A synthetase/AMP-(fatty) acid ligase